ncbi:MAG: protein-transmembrane prediction [Gammaproteobacteria bacterium]
MNKQVILLVILLAVHADDDVHAGTTHNKVKVSSIKELRKVMTKSHQQIVMTPGIYVVSDLLDNRTVFHLSGSNNVYDLSGVTIQIPLSTLRKMTSRGAHGRAAYRITGDRITLKGGIFENTYDDGTTTITDFGSYNQNSRYHPAGGMNEISISGDDVQIIDCKLTVRGSFPYGYGNIYGIGRGNVVGLKKHGGIHSTGNRLTIDSCQVKMEAFCHAIFFTGGDDITVRNTLVEGGVRPSNDLYHETNNGDLAKRFDYKIQWPESVRGLPIPRDHMLNLTEDGIRAYAGAGHVTVDNCKVMKMRGGIKLYMAKGANVSNCQVLDCVIQGYSLPSRGTITNCSGNAAYGPLLYIHFDSHSSQHIDLEVLPSPHALGDHPLAVIKGREHCIRFTASGSSTLETLRPIIVGYPLRFDFLCVDYPKVPAGYEERFARYAPKTYRASGITVNNGTAHPVVLGEQSRDNTITSLSSIRDYGTNNTLNSIASTNR